MLQQQVQHLVIQQGGGPTAGPQDQSADAEEIEDGKPEQVGGPLPLLRLLPECAAELEQTAVEGQHQQAVQDSAAGQQGHARQAGHWPNRLQDS